MSFGPPRAACGVTPQGAMPADWQSQIGGIPDKDTLYKEKRPVEPGVFVGV